MNSIKILKYTHPASCGYSSTKTYELNELLKKQNIKMIKILFEPINFKWEDLDKKSKHKYKTKVANNVTDGAE